MRWKTFSPTAMSVNQKFSVLQTKLYLTSRTVSCTWNSQPSLLFSQSIVARWPFFPPIRRNLKAFKPCNDQKSSLEFVLALREWMFEKVLSKLSFLDEVTLAPAAPGNGSPKAKAFDTSSLLHPTVWTPSRVRGSWIAQGSGCKKHHPVGSG